MSICGISGRNEEQKELIATLCDKNVDLTIIEGALGSGKTLIATAFAMDLYTRNKADKIVISRPMVPDEDEDIGFLPGTEEEKLDPYLAGFHCAIDVIEGYKYGAKHEWSSGLLDGRIEAKSLATIKGASYKHAVMMLDEAQDATLSQIKKFIGRASSHSKVIVMGDNKQKSRENHHGFLDLISKVHDNNYDFIKYVKLTKVERSKLAAFADKL